MYPKLLTYYLLPIKYIEHYPTPTPAPQAGALVVLFPIYIFKGKNHSSLGLL